MRIVLTAPVTSLVLVVLCALLLEPEWKGASAFGVPPTTTTTRTLSRGVGKSSSSSLHAVEATVIVDAITNGGSVMVHAATAVVAKIATVASPANLQIEASAAVDAATAVVAKIATVANPANIQIEASAAAGGVFGASGFIVGALTTSSGKANKNNKNNKNNKGGELIDNRSEDILREKTAAIEDLTANLAKAEEQRIETQASGDEAVDRLENQIFLMDQEFEESTQILQDDFEKRVKRELTNRGAKLEQDLKFKYDVQRLREQERMLHEQLAFMASESSGSVTKQGETALANLEVVASRSTIDTLRNDLRRSETAIEELRTLVRYGANPLNSIFKTGGLKMELADLQTDFSTLEETLLEKEQQIEGAQQELEELQDFKRKATKNNPLYFVTELFQSKAAQEEEEVVE